VSGKSGNTNFNHEIHETHETGRTKILGRKKAQKAQRHTGARHGLEKKILTANYANHANKRDLDGREKSQKTQS
jgi:hypothetical protein